MSNPLENERLDRPGMGGRKTILYETDLDLIPGDKVVVTEHKNDLDKRIEKPRRKLGVPLDDGKPNNNDQK